MTDRRGLVVALVGGLAAGGLALLGVSRPWATVDIVAAGVPRSTIETAGTSAVPWVGALTLVVLTGALAIIPTGPAARRVVGALVLLAAMGAAVGTLLAGPAIDDALAGDLAQSPASGGVDDQAMVDAADHPPWRWLTLGASVAGVAVGLLVVAHGHRWPTMGSRYDAPTRAGGADDTASKGSDDADLWKAMDEGRDPTA
ncbi:MAG TPA: Trp biosynthesis-associated membrane protein [Nocardioidaceae bacterium]|nr:Trp biosynthesis-associated membrane protein [Nocardioidaceae bacterium]